MSCPNGLLAVRGCNCQVVDPPAVTVEPDHGRTYQRTIDLTYEEQLWLRCELAGYVRLWIVPRTSETRLLPKRYDSSLIRRAKCADFHVRGTPNV